MLLEECKLQRPYFSYVSTEECKITLTSGNPLHEQFRQDNFDLCRSLDMNRLAVVLERMWEAGHLTRREAELYRLQASTLLASIRSAHARSMERLQYEEK